jgi:hypothetical protein
MYVKTKCCTKLTVSHYPSSHVNLIRWQGVRNGQVSVFWTHREVSVSMSLSVSYNSTSSAQTYTMNNKRKQCTWLQFLYKLFLQNFCLLFSGEYGLSQYTEVKNVSYLPLTIVGLSKNIIRFYATIIKKPLYVLMFKGDIIVW